MSRKKRGQGWESPIESWKGRNGFAMIQETDSKRRQQLMTKINPVPLIRFAPFLKKAALVFAIVVIPLHAIGMAVQATGEKRDEPKQPDANYIQSVEDWRFENEKKLASPNGWLALTAHVWLEPGEQSIGIQPSDPIRLPTDLGESARGIVRVDNGRVSLLTEEGSSIRVNGEHQAKTTWRIDSSKAESDSEDIVTVDDRIRLQLVRRSNRLAIRVRDARSDAIARFSGKKWFPVNPKYRVDATYHAYESPKSMPIVNIRGDAMVADVVGYVEFTLDDKSYRLDAMLDSPTELFLIFKDLTSGETTYGPGRFLNAPLPEDGATFALDFNKSYNPPCAFSPHTLCPMPPKQNQLPVKITAGEKRYDGKGADVSKEASPKPKVYSGPQVGEAAPNFRFLKTLGADEPEEIDPIALADGKAALLVFLHDVNRQSISMTRNVTKYAASRKNDGLTTSVILLGDDASAAEATLKRIQHALTPGIPTGVSLDGREGPGAYGLNRNVQLTVLVIDNGNVAANFALIQPSLQVDLPNIAAAIVERIGGDKPELKQLLADEPQMQRAANSQPGNENAGVDMDRLRSMVRPLIQLSASDEQVDEAAIAIEKEIDADPKIRREIGRIASTIVGSGNLANYGTPRAQGYLKLWAEKYGTTKENSNGKP